MKDTFNNIETSFRKALKGEEEVKTLIYRWAVISYAVAYFIVNKAIMAIDLKFIDITLSALAICFFAWHFYVLRKCTPKEPVISKEEKKRLKEEARKGRSKRILRKLLLKEPIRKWNPITVCLVTDVFCIAQFLDYIIR